jgi:5'-deoxynucleotidase YfbR-like HD superfamily hydrolase
MDEGPKEQPFTNDHLKISRLLDRLLGGHVTRYHTRPEVGNNQSVAEHTWRAVVILHTLWPDISREALLYLLYHDVTEAELGDLPATTKWKYHFLAEEYRKVETDYQKTLGIVNEITEREKHLCKMADMLELVMHCHRQVRKGNTFAEKIYTNGIEFLRNNFKTDPNFGPVEQVILELEKYDNQ